MNSKHLYYLSVILEKGSMAKAAKSLSITQPTLTRAMATLEMQAGTQLFSRSRHGVKATAVGEALAREGRLIELSTERALQFVSKYRIGLDRELRIGVGPVLSLTIFSKVLSQLSHEMPRCSLNVEIAKPSELYDGLLDDRYDIILAPPVSSRDPDGLTRELICKDEYGIFCGKSHQYNSVGTLSPEHLRDAEWLTLGYSSPFERNVYEMLMDNGVSKIRTRIAFKNDAALLLQMLEDGRHLAVLPKIPMKHYQNNQKLIELAVVTNAPKNRDLYIFSSEKYRNSAEFKRIKELLIELYQ